MARLQTIPSELLDLIIEQLVLAIGIEKAVLLRTVSHTFDAAIIRAVCISQVVDWEDPEIPCTRGRMAPKLKAKIILVKTRAPKSTHKPYVAAVAKVNEALDSFIVDDDAALTEARHESIAAAVSFRNDPITAEVEAQNLLCGAALVGNLPVVKMLLSRNPEGGDDSTTFFENPLTLAASCGHIEVVRHLLDIGFSPDAGFDRWCEYPELLDLPDWNKKSASGCRGNV